MAHQQHPVARTDEIVGDELLVYDLDSGRAHCLDAAAADIWRGCDGRSGVAELADRLEVSDDVIWAALERLAELDLLAGPVSAPAEVSRRTVLRRGLVAGAAGIAAVPIVKWISRHHLLPPDPSPA